MLDMVVVSVEVLEFSDPIWCGDMYVDTYRRQQRW